MKETIKKYIYKPTKKESNPNQIIGDDVQIGKGTKIWNFVNLYGCEIGNDCMIGTFVEVQNNVVIGDYTRISSHSFICSGTTIGKRCFIGHGVMTVNDTFSNGQVNYDDKKWGELVIEDDVIVGSNCVLMPVTIGRGAIIGANSIVTKDVPPYTTVMGVPARVYTKKKKKK